MIHRHKILPALFTLLACASLMPVCLLGCQTGTQQQEGSSSAANTTLSNDSESSDSATAKAEGAAADSDGIEAAPKYVFLFIGDGMSYPQIQLASSYLGACADNTDDQILDGAVPLNFMTFPSTGSAITCDSTSFCPDSASTATALSTGNKTYSSMLNISEDGSQTYVALGEQLKRDTSRKVGLVTSTNINHATPAAFYAHQQSRTSYYDIGVEMAASNIDYLAGGTLLSPDGDGSQENLYELAAEAGYTVARTQEQAVELDAADGKALVVTEHPADANTLSYQIDQAEGAWDLADYVQQGIEMLDGEDGFFLMCEGGKIDTACHANDAGSALNEVLGLQDAVQVAIDFAQKHPDETLIVVTGDHETGGLSLGFAETRYDTHLENFTCQRISYVQFDADYIQGYLANITAFSDAMLDVEELFGLTMPERAAEAADPSLVLSESEVKQLEEAYQKTFSEATSDDGSANRTEEELVLYGSYTPFSVAITHMLANKSGVNFSSYFHTGLPTAVFAQGEGAELFAGYYENTEIHSKLCLLLGLENLASK